MSSAERDPQSTRSPITQQAEQARAAVQKEAKENYPNKDDFKKKMQETLNKAKTKVQDLQKQIIREAASKSISDAKKEEKKVDLFSNLVTYLQVLKESSEHPDYKLKLGELGITDEKAGNLLLKIQSKLPLTISTNSVLPLSQFIFEVSKTKPKKADVKRAWDKLTKDVPTDLPLLRALRDSLIEAVKKNDIEGFSNEEEARVAFTVPNDNVTPFQSAGLSPAEQAEVTRVQKAISSFTAGFDREEKKSINDAVTQSIQGQDAETLFSLMPEVFNNNLEEAENFVNLKSRSGRGGIQLLKNLIINYGVTSQEVESLSTDFIYKNLGRVTEVSGGEITFSSELKEDMRNAVFRVVTAILTRTTSNLNDHFSPSNEEKRAINYLQQAVNRLIGDPLVKRRLNETDPTGQLYKDFTKFMHELIVFIDEEQFRRGTAHNLVYTLVNGSINMNNMKDTATKVNISTANNILSGYQGSIVDMATHLIPQYIQHRTAIKNKNEYAADLWAMKRGAQNEQLFPDFDGIRKALRRSILEVARDLRNNPTADKIARKEFMDAAFDAEGNVNDESLKAAVERAMSLGLLLSFSSMRAPVEASLVKAPQSYLPTPFYDQWNIKLQYGIMKAHDIKKSSDWIMDYIPELRSEAFRIRTTNEFGNLWERVSNGEASNAWSAMKKHKGWVPSKLYKSVDTTKRMSAKALMNRLKGEVPDPDFATYDDEISLREAYGDMSTFDIFSVGGGRIGGMKRWVDGEMTKQGKNPGNWEEKYEFARANVGAGSLWMWDGARAGDEVKALLIAKFKEMLQAKDPRATVLGIGYKDKYSGAEQELIFNEFRPEHARSADTKIHDNLTAKQLEERRMTYLRSSNFLSLLERSPDNFLYVMARLEPELAQTVSTKKGGEMSAYDFYFNDDKLSLLDSDEVTKRRAQRNMWKGRWTEAKNYLGDKDDKGFSNYYNFDRLKQVAFFWHRYYMNAAVKDVEGDKKLDSGEVKKAQDRFFERMSAATRRVMMKNKGVMTKEDIIDEADANDSEGRLLAELFFNDQNGLVREMQKLKEDFGTAEKAGDKKFFYWMANRWFNHDFRGGVLPTQSDIKMSAMMTRASETWAETLFADGYTRTMGWNESAVKAIADIDNTLLKAAAEKNISGIVQLHEKIHTLRGTIGVDVSKLHYFIATAVVRFYQKDFRLRAPWPFNNLLYGLKMDEIDKDMALSTRYKSYGALQFTEENIREYGTYLTKRGFLKAYGDWSRDMLWNSLGADREKYLKLQAAPSIFLMATSLSIGNMIESALTEFAGDFVGKK